MLTVQDAFNALVTAGYNVEVTRKAIYILKNNKRSKFIIRDNGNVNYKTEQELLDNVKH